MQTKNINTHYSTYTGNKETKTNI